MKIDKVIASLPAKSPPERKAIRGHAEAWLRSGTNEQQEHARTVLAALDQLEQRETDELVEHVLSLPKARRVVEAFTIQPMTDTEQRVIQVLLDHPGSTSTKLTAALGWRGQAWHMHFGTMCYDRRARLWPAPPAEKRNAEFYSGILADFDQATSSFTMNPEAAAGFEVLGLAPRSSEN